MAKVPNTPNNAWYQKRYHVRIPEVAECTATSDSAYTKVYAPIDLFPPGTPGCWYEVAPRYLWQDVARTLPVTAAGQAVASMQLNTAAGPIYAEQATGAQQPIFQTDGVLNWLVYDGAADGLITPGTMDFSAVDKIYGATAVRKLSDAVIGAALAFGGSVSVNNGAFQIRAPGSVGGATASALTNNGSTLYSAHSPASYASPITFVAAGTNDNAASLLKVRVNGAVVNTNIAAQAVGNYGNYTLSIGRQTAATQFFSGNIYGGIIRGGALPSDAELLKAEQWLGSLAGISF